MGKKKPSDFLRWIIKLKLDVGGESRVYRHG